MTCTKTGPKNDPFFNCRRKTKELSKKELSNVAPASVFSYFQNSIFWPPLSWLSHQSYFSISFLISSVAFFSFLFFFKEKKILFNFENVKSFMADNKCQFTYECYFVAWRKYKWKLSLMTITLLGRTVFRTKIHKKCLLGFLSILW